MNETLWDRSNLAQPVGKPCRWEPVTGVGDVRSACQTVQTQPYPQLDDELEIHIEDCHWQYRTAYERFQLHGCPHDRDEALLHLHRMNAAILARSPAVQAARHAEFERRLDEGVDFFQSEHAMALAREGDAQ